MPEPVTPQGREVQSLYNIVFVIAAAIFLFVEGLIVYAVLRYRRKPTDTALPVQTHGNNLLEVIWTVIPTVIVLILFVLSWQTLNSIERSRRRRTSGSARSPQRFQWSFEYLSPDGQQVLFTQLAPEMAVPVGTTVHLSLRSPDVIHAFYVPRFLFKRDVVPGQENVFEFAVDEDDAGQSFGGQCAELCGDFHGAMVFTVRAMTQADYDGLAPAADRRANATPPPPPSGAPSPGRAAARRRAEAASERAAGPGDSPAGRPEHRVRQDRDHRAAPAELHDRVPQQRRRHPAQRRDQGRRRGVALPGRDLQRSRTPGSTPSPPWMQATTPSSAPCTRT